LARAVEAQLRFQQRMADLTLSFVKSAFSLHADALREISDAVLSPGNGPANPRAAWQAPPYAPPSGGGFAPRDAASTWAAPGAAGSSNFASESFGRAGTSERTSVAPSLVLEGPVGTTPKAAFLIENTLTRAVAVSFDVKPSLNPSVLGITRGQLSFVPDQLVLQPGEQAIVHVSTQITESFQVGQSYQGEIEIVGLPASAILVVARRLTDAGTIIIEPTGA
jgi:hypothetical protein